MEITAQHEKSLAEIDISFCVEKNQSGLVKLKQVRLNFGEMSYRESAEDTLRYIGEYLKVAGQKICDELKNKENQINIPIFNN